MLWELVCVASNRVSCFCCTDRIEDGFVESCVVLMCCVVSVFGCVVVLFVYESRCVFVCRAPFRVWLCCEGLCLLCGVALRFGVDAIHCMVVVCCFFLLVVL